MSDPTCAKCAAPIVAGSQFCNHCGARLSAGRRSRFSLALILVVPLLLVAAGGIYLWLSGAWAPLALRVTDAVGLDPCSKTKTEAYFAEAMPILDRWLASYELAASSPRIALSTPIRDMQGIRSEFAQLQPPECLAVAHRQVHEGMSKTITAFLGFMAQQDDELVGAMLEEGLKKFDWGMSTMVKVRQGQ